MVAMMNVKQFPRFPPIIAHRRPVQSMKRIQQNWAIRAMIEDIP